jgi:hypothetical protein
MKRTPLTRSAPLQAKAPMRQISDKRKADGKTAVIKAKHKRLTPAQDNARGKPCTLRLDGCRGDPAYTVLCHIRRNGWAGAGQKPPDFLAFFACDRCHEKQERHHPDCTDADLMRAMGETLRIQFANGIFFAK